jgi:site-specific recombinase
MVGLEFDLAWSLAVFAALGVLGIGLVNLLVSFSLALWVGLKARGVSFEQRRALASALLLRLVRQPRDFILPPRAAPSHGE